MPRYNTRRAGPPVANCAQQSTIRHCRAAAAAQALYDKMAFLNRAFKVVKGHHRETCNLLFLNKNFDDGCGHFEETRNADVFDKLDLWLTRI